jgi:hypothetical protein
MVKILAQRIHSNKLFLPAGEYFSGLVPIFHEEDEQNKEVQIIMNSYPRVEIPMVKQDLNPSRH